MTLPRPFQRLDDRLAGREVDETLYEGVPVWLEEPLRDWLRERLEVRVASRRQLAARAALRLRLDPRPGVSDSSRIADYATGDQLLIHVDAILQLHPDWPAGPWAGDTERVFVARVNELDLMLSDGASAYRVDWETRCLVRRVDATVQAAVHASIKAAPAAAADHLSRAWVATYGLAPDPDKALHEAVRAVEELACPLVENRRAEKNLATLGSVLGELRNNSADKWELVLPGADGQPRSIEHFVGMMTMLWQSQVSRHGGGAKSRRQDQAEAEAAVQLAVLLVHWLATNVLRRKS